jgi:hypothetical protein
MIITIGNKIINEKIAAEAYMQCWNYLYENRLISESILTDFPLYVKKQKDDWNIEQKKDAHLITNSTNLWVSTLLSKDDIVIQLNSIFTKYSIEGNIVNDSERDNNLMESETTQPEIKKNYIKYYKINIDSLITTFSKIESGKEMNFSVKTEQTLPNDISINDKIIVSIYDNVYYNFTVTDLNTDNIKLYKIFEVAKSIELNIESIGVFEQIGKEEYEFICSQLFSDFYIEQKSPNPLKKIGFENIKEEFANWLFVQKKYFRVYNDNIEILREKLNEYEIAYNNDFGILIFDYPNISIETIINALETNKIDNTGEIGDLNKKTVGNGSVKAILGSNNYIKFLKELLLKSKKALSKSPKTTPVNKIYFGAPGTGKSYQITQDMKDIDLIFQKRVTFHPEYDYPSFVGGYKPLTDNDGNIKYEFVPQIFTNIYVEACNDPDHQYYLIIEEINRGNCAEIFGDLFQLLDRDKNYKITPSNEVINYLSNNISNSDYYKDGKMLLPDNLSIISTMNTSDQSLFPMDSAFKRRWEWEYIPINYSKDGSINKSANYTIVVDSTIAVNWIDFIKKINLKIQENQNLGMDKCIGNYFIKPSEKGEIWLDNFIHKVIFYLWNDVFKDETKDSIFKDKVSYQSFFPTATEGLKLVVSIFKDLNLLETNKTEEE